MREIKLKIWWAISIEKPSILVVVNSSGLVNYMWLIVLQFV